MMNKAQSLFDIYKKERSFLILILILFSIAALLTPYPFIAAWFGFALAAYSAVSNDSIQTIGTFLASNSKRPWWMLWLFIGCLFIATVTYSFVKFSGDVTYQRLATKGFNESPTSFSYLQIAAPIFLLIITRLRMPVSTTFLLLSSFAAGSGAIGKVLLKSFTGYALAFGIAIVVYLILGKLMKNRFKGTAKPIWTVIQWLISGTLWSLWIMQDAANIAVYLPRSLGLGQFIIFALVIFAGLGLLFYYRGGRIQKIVNEKSNVTDVRPATIIDFVYSILLAYHLYDSTVPMSTTWVFLGLLGGRELGMSIVKAGNKSAKKAAVMIVKDASLALSGLLISIIIATAVNPNIREQILAWF